MQSPPLSFPPFFIRIYTLVELPFCFFGTCALEFHSRIRIPQRYERRRPQIKGTLLMMGRELGGKSILAGVWWIVSGERSREWLINSSYHTFWATERQFTQLKRNLCLEQSGSLPLGFYMQMTLNWCIVAWVSRKRIIKNIDNFSTTCRRSHPIIIYMFSLASFLLSKTIILSWPSSSFSKLLQLDVDYLWFLA